jgi:lipoprotein-releasing system permease protein
MLSYPFKIALRYFFSKSSQTVINRINSFAFLMVVVSTASLFTVLSAFAGLKNFGLSFSESFDPDYQIEPQQGKYMDFPDSLLQNIQKLKAVKAVAPQIEEKVFLSFNEKNQVAYLKAIDSNFTSVVPVDKLIALGDWISFDGPDVVIGFGIAGNLSVGVYDYSNFLTLTVPNKESQSLLNQNPFSQVSTLVVGLYQLNEELDKKYVFSRMELARELLNLNPQQVSSLVLKTEPSLSQKELLQMLSPLFNVPIKLISRAEQNEALYKMLNVEHLAIYFIFTLVMLIALFNVIGALIMMVLDKQDQLKILLSMGASPQGIHRVFFLLGLFICSVGGLVGLAIGTVLVLAQSYFPFIYVPGTSLSYPVVYEIENLFIVMGTLMTLGTLSTAWATRGFEKKIGAYTA